MPNSKIFCNIPWFELNINNDGSFDLCGCQNDKILGTPLGQIWNIKKMTIEEYWNSPRMREARLRKLGEMPDAMCRACQLKDELGYESPRRKENMKSLVFLDSFERSYQQSPNLSRFQHSENNQGATETTVHSLHINLGDKCNFACRMCNPWASTPLQREWKELGWVDSNTNFDHWSDDPTGWANFMGYLERHPDSIRVMHIIGGEVAFIPKFDFLLNHLVEKDMAKNINFSFTINGSVDYTKYFDRLAKFKRTEIGISIESVEPVGDYIRQAGRIKNIMSNIEKLKKQRPDNMSLAIRTVPSILSLPTYASLIKWCYELGIPIDNSMLVNPLWQQAKLLPDTLKQKVIEEVSAVLDTLPKQENKEFNNQKDPHKIDISMRNECESIIGLAKVPAPVDAEQLRKTCAEKLNQWDKLKKINLKDYSAELYEFLSAYGYKGHRNA